MLHTDPAQFMRTPAGRIATLQPPGPNYPLGTDDVGRDVLTRLLYAGQVSLLVGFLVASRVARPGCAAGTAGRLFRRPGRRPDQRLVQFVLNIPPLFVLIVLSIFLTPNVVQLALIFGLFFWPSTARQVRAVVLSARNRDYVDAARVLGARDARIMARHILPNVASVAIVVAGLDMAAAILAESSLSFLGFGVPVPLSSWGNMLSSHRTCSAPPPGWSTRPAS